MAGLTDRFRDDPQFRELRRRYTEEALEDARELRGILDGCGGALPEGEQGLRFRKLAHDLRGSGGVYGFPIVSLYGGEVEDSYLEGAAPAALSEILRMLEKALREAGTLV